MNQIVSAQLYTLRDKLKTEEEFILGMNRLKEMGFTHVQFSGVPAPLSPVRVREILDSCGILVCCSHMPWDKLLNDTERVAEDNLTMGCPIVGLSSYPENKLETREETLRFVAQIEKVSRVLQAHGLKFAYHNHTCEFHRFDGKTVLQHLREMTDPAAVEFIFCCYWAQVGGVDPVAYLHEFAGRVSCCHYKDMVMLGGNRNFAPVGEGNMNYQAIWQACEQTGVRYALIEQDVCHGDPFESMAISRANMLAMGRAYDGE
ncbi:MAG: sugar phosphate isomerase/epimerase [Clostridia bacterium]|nr:sugar phosphate isomerase/epimerase [Clostridia bacterium]